MALPVSLRDVVEAMDLPNNDWQSYLNRVTGEIVTVTDEDRRLVEDGEDLDKLPEWQRETLTKVCEVLESEWFFALPGSFDVHEWSIMEQFAQSHSNARQRDEMLDSLHGRGAFRMFRSAIRRLGIEDDLASVSRFGVPRDCEGLAGGPRHCLPIDAARPGRAIRAPVNIKQ